MTRRYLPLCSTRIYTNMATWIWIYASSIKEQQQQQQQQGRTLLLFKQQQQQTFSKCIWHLPLCKCLTLMDASHSPISEHSVPNFQLAGTLHSAYGHWAMQFFGWEGHPEWWTSAMRETHRPTDDDNRYCNECTLTIWKCSMNELHVYVFLRELGLIVCRLVRVSRILQYVVYYAVSDMAIGSLVRQCHCR